MTAVEVHLTTGHFEPRWHKIDLYEDEWLARDVDVAIEDRYQPAMPCDQQGMAQEAQGR